MKFKTINELHDAVKAGEINESELEIILDNDCTTFYVGEIVDEKLENRIDIEEETGSCREPFFKLLFPKAKVRWC